MSARQIAIGKALQELEPNLLDAARMARLVASHAEDWLNSRIGGTAAIPGADVDALLFGIYDVEHRIRQLKEAYEQAVKPAPVS